MASQAKVKEENFQQKVVDVKKEKIPFKSIDNLPPADKPILRTSHIISPRRQGSSPLKNPVEKKQKQKSMTDFFSKQLYEFQVTNSN